MTLNGEPSTPTLAIVNASSRHAGTSHEAVAWAQALTSAGFGIRWYQCHDEGKEPVLPPEGTFVRGAGFTFEPFEMGVNRLWVFGRRIGEIPEDLVYLTDPTLAFIARNHPGRIVQVHDLIPLGEFADRLDQSLMFLSLLPSLRRMSRILVPTTAVQEELLGYGIEPEQIRVVAHVNQLGIHPDHIESSVDRMSRTGTLKALYVATDRPRKNLDFILRLAKVLESSPDGRRVTITLRSTLRRRTTERLKRLGVSNIRVIEYAPSMPALYEDHDVLIYPSRQEGFGLPLIEALGFGMPVLANRIAPFPEVLGEAGTLLSVESPEAWADTLTSLLNPTTLRAHAGRSIRASYEYTPKRFRSRLVSAIQDLLPPGRVLPST